MSQPVFSCPNLGIIDDPATYSAYPTRMNVCYHVRPIQTPKINHQRIYCLQSSYIHCPVYKAQPGGKMPQEIEEKTRKLSPIMRRRLISGGIAVILIAIFAWFGFGSPWIATMVEEIPPTVTPPEVTSPVTGLAPIGADQPTQTPSPTQAVPTPTDPPPTPTREDPILALGTPIGDEIQFIIHRVEEGETLQIFADQYNTTVEAITAINHNLIVPLWTNWLVIIPLNISDVSDLPAFEASQVDQEDVLLRDLA
jgi:hypothetical protein